MAEISSWNETASAVAAMTNGTSPKSSADDDLISFYRVIFNESDYEEAERYLNDTFTTTTTFQPEVKES